MIKKRLIFGTATFLSLTTVPIMATGLASAVSSSTTSSKLTSKVVKQERLQAQAEVLKTSTSNIQAAKKAKTLPQLVAKSGLSKDQYRQKVLSQLTTDLEAKGYTKAELTSWNNHHKV